MSLEFGQALAFFPTKNELETVAVTANKTAAIINGRRKRRFILVAGQSNTDYGRGPIDPLVLDEIPSEYRNFEPRLKMLVRDSNYQRLSLAPATFQPIDQDSANGGHGYAYLLGRQILDTMPTDEELIIVQVAVGGTGWSNNRWAGYSDLWMYLVEQTRYAIQALDASCIGFFWSQGETDVADPWGAIYKHLLPNMVMTIRKVIGDATGDYTQAFKVPFCTFDMSPAWVAANPLTAQRVQDVLTNIGTTIPYAANIAVTYAADLETDQIHYDSRQQIQIAKGLYTAWQQAKESTFTLPTIQPGEHLLFRQKATPTSPVSNKWAMLDQNSDVADPLSSSVSLYSKLGLAWMYMNQQRNTFKYRYECIGGSVPSAASGNCVFEQSYTPFSFAGHSMPASLVSTNILLGNHGISGFSGLCLTATTGNDALCTLTGGGSTQWWAPIGLSTVFSVSSVPVIPIYRSHSGAQEQHAQEVRLYAVVD